LGNSTPSSAGSGRLFVRSGTRAQGGVGLKTYVPADAFTANTLGTERAGSGVVINDKGLVATIGYLISEAETDLDHR